MFYGEHYIEISGTVIGIKMDPFCANILLRTPFKPLSWLLFIDDIEMKWVGNRECLNHFIIFANSFHNSIEFKVDISRNKKTYFGHYINSGKW